MNDKHSILIVEDEIITAMYMQSAMEDEGYEIIGIESTGEKSIETALDKNPQIILMDINLGGEMNGIEAAERILVKIKTNIIFMTGYGSDMFFKKAMALTPAAYLNKPVQTHDLLNVIKRL